METVLCVLLAVYLLGCVCMFGSLVRRVGWLGSLALGFLVFAWPVVLIDGRGFGRP